MSDSPRMHFDVGDQYEVVIDRLSQGGGRGVTRIKGVVVFVPFSVPGDKLLVKISKLKKTYAEAEILEIVRPALSRRLPECQVFGQCGGCSLQMMTYEAQLSEKQGFVDHMLKSLRLDYTFEVKKIQGSPKSFRYRNRIQLRCEDKKLGFNRRNSNEFIKIEDCLIADKRLIEAAQLEKHEVKKFEVALTEKDEVIFRDRNRNPKALLFSQVNDGVNAFVKTEVSDFLKSLPQMNLVYDLYAGAGNFSFLIAEDVVANAILGVELSKDSVKQARSQNQHKNLSFKSQDVADFLEKTDDKVDFIFMDPPREGLGNRVVQSLKRIGAEHLVYLSCDLPSARRDLTGLLDFYKMEFVQAFDMFPQTDHVETVFILKNKFSV